MIKYSHMHRGHRFGYISSNYWGASIPAFTSGVVLPVGTALGGFGVVLSLLTLPTWKFSNGLMVKQGKDDAIMLLAQSKLA